MPAAESDGTEINNASLVLRAATPAGRVLLSGDVELAAQARLLDARVDLSAGRDQGAAPRVPVHVAGAVRGGAGADRVGECRGRATGTAIPARSRSGCWHRPGTLVLRTDTGGDTAIVPTDDRAAGGDPWRRSPP